MSGQAAIRGFTYQTIISVIKSLTEPSWEYVTVEPKTDNEKVDIVWEDKAGQLKCQQVKSSIHNFSQSDIERWICEMVNDVPQAKSFELLLIGYMATGTDKFINTLKGNSRVEIIMFNQEYLESRVRDEVSRFMSKAGYHLPHDTISLIAGALIYQFFQFSVLSRKVSRKEFADSLLEWVNFNYKKDLGITPNRSELNIKFYDKENRLFVSEISAFHFDFEHETLGYDYYYKVGKLYNRAKEIPLERRRGTSQERSVTFPLIDADVPDFQRSAVTEKLMEYFNASVDEDFFNVGNLKQNLLNSSLPFSTGNSFEGTTQEKEKRQILNELFLKLEEVSWWRRFIHFLNKKHAITLAIQNSGGIYDEDVTVDIRFPDHCEIISAVDLHIPNMVEILDGLIDRRFLIDLLKVQPDSQIMAYHYDFFIDFAHGGYSPGMNQFQNESQQKGLKLSQVFGQLKNVLDFEVFNDLPDFTILRFHFKKVNPNESIAFPCHILFEAKKSFTMEYSITTKNSKVIQKGELHCLVTNESSN